MIAHLDDPAQHFLNFDTKPGNQDGQDWSHELGRCGHNPNEIADHGNDPRP